MFVSPWAHLLDTVPPFPRPHTLFLRLSGQWWWWWWGGGAAFWASEAPSTSQLLGDTWVAPGPPGWALGRWGLLLCRLKETVGVWRVRRGASFCGRPGVAHAGAIPRFTPQPCTRALGTHSTASDKRRPGGPESRGFSSRTRDWSRGRPGLRSTSGRFPRLSAFSRRWWQFSPTRGQRVPGVSSKGFPRLFSSSFSVLKNKAGASFTENPHRFP